MAKQGKLFSNITKAITKREKRKASKEQSNNYGALADDERSSERSSFWDEYEERERKKAEEKNDDDNWWSAKKPVGFRKKHYGRDKYGGFGDDDDYAGGNYRGYQGYGGYSGGYKRKQNNVYSGGSSSIYQNSSWYGSSFSSGFDSNTKAREMLEVKSYVTNIVNIHFPESPKSTKVITRYGLPNIYNIENVIGLDVRGSKIVPIIGSIISSNGLQMAEKMDILSGQALVSATLLNGDFRFVVTGTQKKLSKFHDKGGENAYKILQNVISVLCENIAEREIKERSPGFITYVEKFNKHYYGDHMIDEMEKASALSFVDLISMFIRNPDGVEEALEAKFLSDEVKKGGAQLLDTLKRFAPEANDVTRENVFEVALKIVNIMMVALTFDKNTNMEAAIDKEMNEEDAEQLARDLRDLSSGIGGGGSNLGSGKAPGIGAAAMQSCLAMEMSQSYKGSNSSVGSSDLSTIEQMTEFEARQFKQTDLSIPIDEVDGIANSSKWVVHSYTFTSGDKAKYAMLKDSIKSYLTPLKKAISFRDSVTVQTITSQKRGRIDRGKLALANSTDRIHYKKVKEQSEHVSICLLIDESGSMRGNKIDAARQLATLFSEAFMDSKSVDIYLYGHTYSGGSYGRDRNGVTVYKYTSKTALANVQSRSCNVDGVAIYEVGREFDKKAKGEKKIMMVLSDGNPYGGGYCGSAAVEHTKKCVDAVEKMGVNVMQIAIEPNVESKRMFKRFVTYTNMNTFIKDMSGMIRKLLKE